MAQDALRGDPAVDARRRLLRNLAEVAILAGWLACEDLGNAMSGRAYYSLALDTAREAADDQLTAIAYGHAAHLAAEGLITPRWPTSPQPANTPSPPRLSALCPRVTSPPNTPPGCCDTFGRGGAWA